MLLHFGQMTAKSAKATSEELLIGINSDSFFTSRFVANTICFAVQYGLGQSKDGSRRRSFSVIVSIIFVHLSSANVCDTILLRHLEFAIHLQQYQDMSWYQDYRNEVCIFSFSDQNQVFLGCSFHQKVQ